MLNAQIDHWRETLIPYHTKAVDASPGAPHTPSPFWLKCGEMRNQSSQKATNSLKPL
jgi:hypothetical protein